MKSTMTSPVFGFLTTAKLTVGSVALRLLSVPIRAATALLTSMPRVTASISSSR